jgi:hypothetical protein
MPRALSLLCLVTVLCLPFTLSAAADAIVDKGPPYTDAEFIALAPDRMPVDFHRRVAEWWVRAPDYLRKHVLSSPSAMWWPIIECNFMGFRADMQGPMNSAKCEQDAYRASQRGKSMWSEDGQWIGPSEACKKRDKRTEWGELICD